MHLWKTLVLMIFLAGLTPLGASDSSPSPDTAIPSNYEIGEHTLSPNGSFAILFPKRDSASSNGEFPPNLLVGLQPYRELSRFEPGVPLDATTSLNVLWDSNERLAVWYFRNWGPVALYDVHIDGAGAQTSPDLLTFALAPLRADLKERLLTPYPGESPTILFVAQEGIEDPEPWLFFQKNGLTFHLHADNKPNMAPGPHWSANLTATWNSGHSRLENIQIEKIPVSIRATDQLP